MTESNLIILIISLIFGVLFFIADFYEHKHPKLHVSFIAGISIAYFFLLILPEVGIGVLENFLNIQSFEFLFVVIGFVFVHVSEKLILQKVEIKSQRRMRKFSTDQIIFALVLGLAILGMVLYRSFYFF